MGALIALALQAAVAQAAPLPPADAADLRCIAAFAALEKDAQQGRRNELVIGIMYFVGRIDARSTGLDFEREMLTLIRSGPDLSSDQDRCAAELKSRAAALTGLSRSLQAQAQPPAK